MLDPDNNTTTTAIRSVTSDARVFADSDVVVTVTLVGEPRLGAGKTIGEIVARVARMSSILGAAERQLASRNLKLLWLTIVVAMLLSLVFSKKLIVEVEFVDFLSINGEFTKFSA